MTRPTVASVQAQVDALQAEVAELRALLTQRTERWSPFPAPSPLSEPINFAQLMADQVAAHAEYREADEWGPGTYL